MATPIFWKPPYTIPGGFTVLSGPTYYSRFKGGGVPPTVIRPTQPRGATVPRPSYPFASTAAQLASRGLSPSQVDRAHPPVKPIRGASYTRRSGSAGRSSGRSR